MEMRKRKNRRRPSKEILSQSSIAVNGCSGFLRIKSKTSILGVKVWKRRFCVLDPIARSFGIYLNQNKKEPEGLIPLVGVEMLEETPVGKKYSSQRFGLKLLGARKGIFEFRAESRAEKRRWVLCLKKIILMVDNNTVLHPYIDLMYWLPEIACKILKLQAEYKQAVASSMTYVIESIAEAKLKRKQSIDILTSRIRSGQMSPISTPLRSPCGVTVKSPPSVMKHKASNFSFTYKNFIGEQEGKVVKMKNSRVVVSSSCKKVASPTASPSVEKLGKLETARLGLPMGGTNDDRSLVSNTLLFSIPHHQDVDPSSSLASAMEEGHDGNRDERVHHHHLDHKTVVKHSRRPSAVDELLAQM
mmetsp:Transcript_26696/g.47302  ORF Transcript_26696/g.47302 Transcript_26696/m.47302 type:complete len:359 (+) Transcript_26696:294-1370(+)|eukprot:CAMPEP_0197526620 /NCGR_PEP_ID=MMETSP1318-20131121/18475_1 /TAXON_ID=552666 /ORGANISM="Partenskyella glossopodia, Strain RCC365" /LENGTH=358 /DNA_ID=CAMNT_0043080863 /DNA_START=196 /DNA_END=1272 /DNA_ORIENTATION=+